MQPRAAIPKRAGCTAAALGNAPTSASPANCSWRRDASRELWDQPYFKDIPGGTAKDDDPDQMLCRCTGDLPPEQVREVICQGWVRVLGLDAIGVRLAVMCGAVTEQELDGTDRPDLFGSFEEMMEANRVEMPKRSKWRAHPSGAPGAPEEIPPTES
jgi:hypothetical protein